MNRTTVLYDEIRNQLQDLDNIALSLIISEAANILAARILDEEKTILEALQNGKQK